MQQKQIATPSLVTVFCVSECTSFGEVQHDSNGLYEIALRTQPNKHTLVSATSTGNVRKAVVRGREPTRRFPGRFRHLFADRLGGVQIIADLFLLFFGHRSLMCFT